MEREWIKLCEKLSIAPDAHPESILNRIESRLAPEDQVAAKRRFLSRYPCPEDAGKRHAEFTKKLARLFT